MRLPRQPSWNEKDRELRARGLLVKCFRVPAEMQEAICRGFEAAGWATWIDDPLPRDAGVNPKARLHDTINHLNRNQRNRLLHFRADGTGRRIGWQWIEDVAPLPPEKAVGENDADYSSSLVARRRNDRRGIRENSVQTRPPNGILTNSATAHEYVGRIFNPSTILRRSCKSNQTDLHQSGTSQPLDERDHAAVQSLPPKQMTASVSQGRQ